MPYQCVAPEVYLKHRDVTLYHLYKDDQLENGPRQYWYGLTPDCTDNGPAIDVRELPNPHRLDLETDEGRRSVLRYAIEAGIIPPRKGGST